MSRSFIRDILPSYSTNPSTSLNSSSNHNTLSTLENYLPPETLRSLHSLYPNLLIPALDLLDRDRIRCINPNVHPRLPPVYHALPANHEIRLHAWNCSCPAFTFSLSAYLSLHSNSSSPVSSSCSTTLALTPTLLNRENPFGGLPLTLFLARSNPTPAAYSTLPPICKHLLATYLHYLLFSHPLSTSNYHNSSNCKPYPSLRCSALAASWSGPLDD